MKEAEIQVASSIDTTVPDPGDPTYQMECLALEIRQTLKALKDNNFTFTQAESSDFSTYGGNLKDFIDDMSAREDEILLTGFSSIAATLPDVLPIIEAILSGGTAAIPSILLNAVVSQLFRSRNSAITAREGEIVSDLDAESISDSIDAMATDIEGIKEELQDFKRGLVRPANGETAYFLDQFEKFALDSEDSKLTDFFDHITINIISRDDFQTLDFGPAPEE